jgi:hypothetical protein
MTWDFIGAGSKICELSMIDSIPKLFQLLRLCILHCSERGVKVDNEVKREPDFEKVRVQSARDVPVPLFG